MTTWRAVHHGLAVYDPTIVHGTVLDVAAIDRQIETYRRATWEPPIDRRACNRPGRRSSWPVRCVVADHPRLLDQPSVTVSDRGLRHGVLSERFRNAIRRGAEH